MPEPLAIILAAGKGKRMGSDLPKVLVPVGGRPMIRYVVDAVTARRRQTHADRRRLSRPISSAANWPVSPASTSLSRLNNSAPAMP